MPARLALEFTRGAARVTHPLVVYIDLQALEETGAPYELKETPLGTPSTGGAKPQWFTDAYLRALGADMTSNGKVPVLQDGDFYLTESAVVADNVAAKYASNVNLLPTTPRERAEIAIFNEQVLGKVVMSFYGALTATTKDEATQTQTKDAYLNALKAFSASLERNGGPFLLGSRLTLPDLLVWPFVLRASVCLTHYRKLEVPQEAPYAAYHKFVAAMKARKAAVDTSMPDDYFVEGYRSYAFPATS